MSLLYSVSRYFGMAFLFFAAFYFVVGEMRTVRDGLAKFGLISMPPLIVTVLGLLVIAFAFFAIARFGKMRFQTALSSPTKISPPLSHWHILFQWTLAVAILYQCWNQLTGPMDFDELCIAGAIELAKWNQVLNPFGYSPGLGGSLNQLLTHVISKIFVHLVGMGDWVVRLPSVIFAGLFLWVLSRYNRYLNPWVVGLVFAHLVVNSLVIWYFHSLKGYAALMFFTAMSFLVVQAAVQGHQKKGDGWVYALSLLGAMFSHPFGRIFVLILGASHLLWAVLHPMRVKPFKVHEKLIGIVCLLFPVTILLIVSMATHLLGRGELFQAEQGAVSGGLLRVIGLNRDWLGRLVGLGVFTGLIHHLGKHGAKASFLTIFNLLVVLFLLTAIYLLQIEFIAGRFLLPFLLPFLLWVGEEMRSLQMGWLRSGAVAFAIVLLVLAPFHNGTGIYSTLSVPHLDYYRFIKRSQIRIENATNPCVFATGDAMEGGWAESIYFNRSKKRSAEKCLVHFRLHFPIKPEVPDAPIEIPLGYTYSKLIQDDQGRVLYLANPLGRQVT